MKIKFSYAIDSDQSFYYSFAYILLCLKIEIGLKNILADVSDIFYCILQSGLMDAPGRTNAVHAKGLTRSKIRPVDISSQV